MHLSTEQLSFLARFAKSPECLMLRQVIEGRLADVSKDLRSLVGEQVYRAQGRALELDGLIALLDDAQNRLNRNPSARSQAPRQDSWN
jgi:hypothetical protein